MNTLHRDSLNLRCPYVAPATATEAELCECYAGALRLDAVGRDDDFFDLGGDSLAAEQLALLASERNLAEFPAIKLFSLGTPARLGAWLDGRQTARAAERDMTSTIR